MSSPYQTESQASFKDPKVHGSQSPDVLSNPRSITTQKPHVDRRTKPMTGAEWAESKLREQDTNINSPNTAASGQNLQGPYAPHYYDQYHTGSHNTASQGPPYATGIDNTASHGARNSGHIQSQDQLQRSVEASKQMLFGVYGNTVSIMEEFEGREDVAQRTKLPKSNIPIVDQSWKSNEDVKAVLETQMILFQNQASACPPEVRQSVQDDLKKKTLLSAAVRSEHGRAITATDYYIAQMYEILSQGKTHHDFYDRPSPEIDARTIQENLPHIMSGKHDQAMMDKDFKQDRDKRAVMPDTRMPQKDDRAYRTGAKRIHKVKPVLETILEADCQRFESEGYSSIK